MRKMPTYRLRYEEWSDLSSMADQANNLAILLDFDCTDTILDPRLRARARSGATRALAGLTELLAARLEAIEPSSIRNPQ